MRFLQIAERELRVNARNPWTYRLRWLAGLGFFGLALWVYWATNAGSRRGSGALLLGTLSWIGLFYLLAMGSLRASDALSSERREGTLGLLYLTPLRGTDILAGKLCSHGLGAFYAMLAVLPILALPLLLGGVTGEHVVRVMVAWINGLVLALVVGLTSSALCVQHTRSAPLALFAIVTLAAAPPACGELLRLYHFPPDLVNATTLLSPYTALAFASPGLLAGGRDNFLRSIAVNQAFAWLLLLWVGWRLTSNWRDATERSWRLPGKLGLRRSVLPAGSSAAPAAHAGSKPGSGHGRPPRRWLSRLWRAPLGKSDPFAWWAGRRSGISLVTLLLMGTLAMINVWVAVPFAVAQFGPLVLAGIPGHLVCWLICTGVFHAITLYAAGLAASARVAEDRRTGALELLLAVPDAGARILRGLRAGYERSLLGPATIATLAHLYTSWIAAEIFALQLQSEGHPHVSGWGILFGIVSGRAAAAPGLHWEVRFMLGSFMLFWILFVIAWSTIGSLGRWLGLRMKHAGFVPLACIALVVAPPLAVFSIVCVAGDQLRMTRLPQHELLPTLRWIGIGLVLLNASLLVSWSADAFRRRLRALVTASPEPGHQPEWSFALRLVLRRLAIVALALLVLFGGIRMYQRQRTAARWNQFTASLARRGETLTPASPAEVIPEANFKDAESLRARLAGTITSRSNGTGYLDALLNDGSRFDDTPLDHLDCNYMNGLTSDWTLEPGLQGFWPREWNDAQGAPGAHAFLQLAAPLEDELRLVAEEILRRPLLQEPAGSFGLAAAVFRASSPAERIIDRWQHVFLCRASARLALGQAAPAFADVQSALRLARSLELQPGFHSHGRRHAMLLRLLQPVWEACRAHAWTAEQWQSLQSGLTKLRLFELHTNMAAHVMLGQIDRWTGPEQGQPTAARRLLSSGSDTDLAIALYEMTRAALRRVDVGNRRIQPTTTFEDPIRGEMDYRAKMLVLQPLWHGKSALNIGYVSAWIHQAIVACALERHRLAHGQYPRELQALVPGYLDAVPSDPVRPGKLQYLLNSPTNAIPYVLRSAGPDTMIAKGTGLGDDWTWSFAAPAPSAGIPARVVPPIRSSQ